MRKIKEFFEACRNVGGTGMTQYERSEQLRILRNGIIAGVVYGLSAAGLIWLIASWANVLAGNIAGWNFFGLLWG